MSTKRDKQLDAVKLTVLFQVPFFAPAVAKMPVIWDESIDTACTDGECIRWNPAMFDSLEHQERVTVMVHEVMHPMLGHLWRLPPVGGDWQLANEACDHAINLQLKEFSQIVMGKRLADPFPFPKDYPPLADVRYKDMSEEAIYADLVKIPRSNGGQGNQSGSKGKSGPNSGTPAPGSMGRFTAPKSAQTDPAKSKQLKNDWAGTLIQCAHLAKSRGDLPANMARLIDEIVHPKIAWQDVLRALLREKCSDDYDFTRPDPMFDESGFIMPSMESEKMGPVIFATDTSGSIDNRLLAQFQAEKQYVLDELKPAKLVDIYCDAKIHRVDEYTSGEVIQRNAPGGGGTSFVPVWEWALKQATLPKCVVYLTDGEGDTGSDPGFPIIWVRYGQKQAMPFGETVYAD